MPSVAVEDARQAERSLAMLTAERTRYRNRLHGVLATQGVRLRLQPSFLTQLATLTRPDGAPLPAGVVARLTLQWALLQTVEQALRQPGPRNGRRSPRRPRRRRCARSGSCS